MLAIPDGGIMVATTLSKSRFKLALECPTKVYYSLRRDQYVSTLENDEFLQALADGGFQVGELAKAMYRASDPSAVEVVTRNEADQIEETRALLERPDATVFEGTVSAGNLLVRADVLRKRGSVVDLIEVKSKSFNPLEDSFWGKRGDLLAEWRPYLQDVAFQAHVLRTAFPGLEIRPFLLLVDPTAICSIDGLATSIRVRRDPANHRSVRVDVSPDVDLANLGRPLLREHDVSREVDYLIDRHVELRGWETLTFVDFAAAMAEKVAAGLRVEPRVSKACKTCEFYGPNEEAAPPARRSGYAECIEERFRGLGTTPREKTIFALYNHRKADALLNGNKLRLVDLDDEDVGEEQDQQKIATAHRHRLQIEEASGRVQKYLLEHVIRAEFDRWIFPLHFIDFETSRPTLPFTAGRRPNQQLLFQFSHHMLQRDGRLEHRTECLVAIPGVEPNARVVRALRDALSCDQGTVLHWWDHERNVLKDVRDQLAAGEEPDRGGLCDFIESLIRGSSARLVDMGRPLVAQAAFFAGAEGRSSIKKVLQAVLAQSDYLKARYGRPVYGTPDMPSLNFPPGTVWWQEQEGIVRDPYTLLGQLLPDVEVDRLAQEAEAEEASAFIANGGAAMMAYAELQRADLPPPERERLEKQLKRYCELDTLAMVMVYEALRDWVR
jgi:hypothetical protein